VGLEVHEAPVVSPRSKLLAEEGMVFTVEPGIYVPGLGGVRIEDMVVVTAEGCELLTSLPKELQRLSN
jgi:Xaa-Pro aminopeptidase